MVVNEDTDIISQRRWQRRWCQKCGSLTQVYINDEGEAVALLNEKKKPHLVLPQLAILASKSAPGAESKTTVGKKPATAKKTSRKPVKK